MLNRIKNWFKNLIKKATKEYVAIKKLDYENAQKSPKKRLMLSFLSTYICVVLAFLILFCCTAPVKDFATYIIEEYTSYKSRMDDLETKVENIKKDLVESVLKTIERKLKNPNLEGIQIIEKEKICIIYPDNTNQFKKQVYDKLVEWFEDKGYDSVIFGESYSDVLNSRFYWSDGINPEYDTDLELINNFLKKRGYDRTFSFMGNPEEKRLSPFTNYIIGDVIMQDHQNYKIDFWGLHLWKGSKSILISSNNFKAEIIDGKLYVSSCPTGDRNKTIIKNPVRENKISKTLTNISLDILDKSKRIYNSIGKKE